jgi:hypothetical protein
VWNPTSANTRVVTISACPVTGTETATACALAPALQVVASFDDYPTGIISAPTTAECVVYCGTGMTISSWVWSPVVPTVTSLLTTSGPITGGTSIPITGTGFVSGATSVNFVEESGGTPTSDNVVLAGTVVGTTTSTSVKVTAPSTIVGSTYFVTVTTPGGTSSYGSTSSDVYTYTSVAPTVTSFGSTSPTSGSTAGGTTITLTGTGFTSTAVVKFTEESSGSAVSPSVVLPATSVSVTSDTLLTAVSPSITAGTTYFVTVTTAGGTTSFKSSVVFTYSGLVPVVAFVSPTTGSKSGGTTVTISGTGFVTGATVNFVEESGGSAVSPTVSLAGTNVTVIGSTEITATSPAITVGSAYFVTVTTPTGTSSNSVVFTFS